VGIAAGAATGADVMTDAAMSEGAMIGAASSADGMTGAASGAGVVTGAAAGAGVMIAPRTTVPTSVAGMSPAGVALKVIIGGTTVVTCGAMKSAVMNH